MNRAPIGAAVSEYVKSLAGVAVSDDEPLITSHLLESIAAVQLIDFVEGTFGVEIQDDELVLHNFDTVESIVKLVESKIPADGK